MVEYRLGRWIMDLMTSWERLFIRNAKMIEIAYDFAIKALI